MEIIILLLSAISQTFWTVLQISFIAGWAVAIRKFKVSGQKTALFGFIFLFITMLCSLVHLDDMAGKVAEFVWILFAISFVQEFYHFLKYENK